MKYLLDTNICIALIKQKDQGILQRAARIPTSEIRICSVVKAELVFGARNSLRVGENLSRLENFFGRIQSLPFDDESASHAGMIKATLKSAGTPIGHYDTLISAIALAHDLRLVTRNEREFRRVPGLAVEVW